MPLKINVGLSRKIGEPNYSSRGGNVHFEAEVEATLVRDAEELHKRIRYLFGLAEEALEEQLASPPSQAEAALVNGQSTPARATTRQLALIERLAAQRDVELEALLVDAFDTEACEHLSRSEASRLIDILHTYDVADLRTDNGHA